MFAKSADPVTAAASPIPPSRMGKSDGDRKRSNVYAAARALAFALLFLPLFSARAQYDPGWARNFRLGLLAGFNIEAEFQTGGTFEGSPAPGVYDDGYVRPDDSGNALGLTTLWGYERPEQIQSGVLSLSRTASYTVDSSRSSGEGDAPYFGLDLAYGGVIWHRHPIRVGWEFGFGFLPIAVSGGTTSTGTVNQVTHGFQIPNDVIPPDPPYHGGSSGIGQPSIHDAPSSETFTSTSQEIVSKGSLDVTLYAFRLGPTVFWDAHPKLGLALSAGPAVGLVTGDYRFTDRTGTGDGSVTRGRFSDSNFLWGGYVSGTITYHAVKNGDVYLGFQYMPLGEATFSSAGRKATLDFSGAIYLSAGFNWPF